VDCAAVRQRLQSHRHNALHAEKAGSV